MIFTPRRARARGGYKLICAITAKSHGLGTESRKICSCEPGPAFNFAAPPALSWGQLLLRMSSASSSHSSLSASPIQQQMTGAFAAQIACLHSFSRGTHVYSENSYVEDLLKARYYPLPDSLQNRMSLEKCHVAPYSTLLLTPFTNSYTVAEPESEVNPSADTSLILPVRIECGAPNCRTTLLPREIKCYSCISHASTTNMHFHSSIFRAAGTLAAFC